MNFTNVSFFILAAYSDTGVLKYVLFAVVVSLYIFIIGSNVLLILVICVNRSLHQPMYVFLCSLFVNELFGSSVFFPFLLIQILSDVHVISAPLCFLQVFCLYSYGGVEFLTLSVMSYDRYVAICFPLQYKALMASRRTIRLSVVMWFYPFVAFMILVSMTACLQLCGNVINKVYCNNSSILRLSCFDVTFINIYQTVNTFLMFCFPSMLIFYTYVKIIQVCLSGSKQTQRKAVSTCTPHLLSLLNLCFGCFLEILWSKFNINTLQVVGNSASAYFIACQPLFNPVLYGLKMSKIRLLCKSFVFRRSSNQRRVMVGCEG